MPPGSDSRPAPKKLARLPFFAAGTAFLAVLLFFVPNPLTDLLVSRAVSQTADAPVALRSVRLKLLPGSRRLFLRAGELDARALAGRPGGTVSEFVRRYNLLDWLLIRDSRWLLGRKDGEWRLRMLDAAAGEAALRAGFSFRGGRLRKLNAAFWLPRSIWGRFPEVVEKRFALDASGRRLFKLTWNDGRWTLRGRSAPVLEARWR